MSVLVTILLVIIIIFGVSSAMNSYATAQQAQAVIEVAQVAQVNAWGNLIAVLLLAFVIVALFGLIVLAMWWMRNPQQRAGNGQRERTIRPASEQGLSALPLDDLIRLETLKALRALNAPAVVTPLLDVLANPSEEEPVETELYWLRK